MKKADSGKPRKFSGLDLGMALAALGGLTGAELLDLPVRTSSFAASDLKTLYASAWCFVHGLNAYNLRNIQSVFRAQGVPSPETWFGHAPVYPPTTLAILAPLTSIGMVPAAYAVTILSGLLLALALAALIRYSSKEFRLGMMWKAAMIGLCACSPLLSFALCMGNLSVAASALSILAFTRRRYGSVWLNGVALGLAILLKPHLAIWIAIGMFLLPERAARAVSVRASVFVLAFTGVVAGALAAAGQLGLQMSAFAAIIRAESSAGSSMNVSSREVLPIQSQITSMTSLLGLWSANHLVLTVLGGILLLGFVATMTWYTRLVNTERGALVAIGAWCAIGLSATYHRTHDAIVLLLLLPWVLDRLRNAPRNWQAWTAAALYLSMSIGPAVERTGHYVKGTALNSVPAFLALRQAGLADLCLIFVLLSAMSRIRREALEEFSFRAQPYRREALARVSRPDEATAA